MRLSERERGHGKLTSTILSFLAISSSCAWTRRSFVGRCRCLVFCAHRSDEVVVSSVSTTSQKKTKKSKQEGSRRRRTDTRRRKCKRRQRLELRMRGRDGGRDKIRRAIVRWNGRILCGRLPDITAALASWEHETEPGGRKGRVGRRKSSCHTRREENGRRHNTRRSTTQTQHSTTRWNYSRAGHYMPRTERPENPPPPASPSCICACHSLTIRLAVSASLRRFIISSSWSFVPFFVRRRDRRRRRRRRRRVEVTEERV